MGIFDIRPRAEGGYVLVINVFSDSTEPSKNFVDLVAFKHHMRWLKPCLDTFSSASRDWELRFKDHKTFSFRWMEGKTIPTSKETKSRSELILAVFVHKR